MFRGSFVLVVSGHVFFHYKCGGITVRMPPLNNFIRKALILVFQVVERFEDNFTTTKEISIYAMEEV